MADFTTRARTFARAVRQMPNNIAAVRRELETLPQQRTSATDRAWPDEPEHARTRRLDELAVALAVAREVTPGVAVATATESAHQSLAAIAHDLQDLIGQPVRRVLLAPGTGTGAEVSADGVVVRTPCALGWPRAIYVLVHASTAEQTFLLHPGAAPELDTLADMLRALTDASLALGTVISDDHGTRQLAEPSTICLTRTQHARDLLTRTFLRTAMSTSLDTLTAQAGHPVRRLPRVTGTVRQGEHSGR